MSADTPNSSKVFIKNLSIFDLGLQNYEKSSAEQNMLAYFLCRDGVIYLKLRLSTSLLA